MFSAFITYGTLAFKLTAVNTFLLYRADVLMHSKSAQKLYCIKMKWKVTEERFIVYVAILCFVFIINVSAVFCLFVLFFKFVAIPKVLLDGLTCTHLGGGA